MSRLAIHARPRREQRRSPWLLTIVFLLQPAWAGAQQQDLLSLMQQAQLVFQGTIQKRSAVTEASFPVDERTAVVRVDRILRAADRDVAGGGNLGLGLQVPAGPRFAFELAYNYHAAFTSSPTQRFSQLQLGLLTSF